MPPKGSKRKSTGDEVYVSKPLLKQKKLSKPRLKTIKRAISTKDAELPRKRRKTQSTMTQLDFGRRSYFEAIGDNYESYESEDEPKAKKSEPKSKFGNKSESQHTLTQFARNSSNLIGMVVGDSEDEGMDFEIEDDKDFDGEFKANGTSKPRKAKPKHSNIRGKLPTKSQSQHTLTQYARKSLSNLSRIVVGDSEDEETDSEVEEDEGAPTKFNEKLPGTAEEKPTRSPPRETASGARGSPRPNAKAKDAAKPASPTQPFVFKTPKKKRMLPVPSSRSPPDTRLSTQRTPRHRNLSQYRSPLNEKSVNTLSHQVDASQIPSSLKDALFNILNSQSGPSQHRSLKFESINTPATQINASQLQPPLKEELNSFPNLINDTSQRQIVLINSSISIPILQADTSQHCAPLKDKPSSNLNEQIDTSRPRSPLKQVSVNVSKAEVDLSQESPSKRLAKKSNRWIGGTAKSQPKDSATQLRVRGFNERWALLEQENIRQRSRRSHEPIQRSGFIPSSPKAPIHPTETQYMTLGEETQAMMLELDAEDVASPELQSEESQDVDNEEEGQDGRYEGVVVNEEHGVGDKDAPDEEEQDTEAQEMDVKTEFIEEKQGNPTILEGMADRPEVITILDSDDDQSEPPSSPEIIIPSSQGRARKIIAKSPGVLAATPTKSSPALHDSQPPKSSQEDNGPILCAEESLPESTYHSRSVDKGQASKKDTQDLASDQLYRETQAFIERVSVSPTKPVEASSTKYDMGSPSKLGRSQLPRPSQATTVDETMPPSTYYTHLFDLYHSHASAKHDSLPIANSQIMQSNPPVDKIQVVSSPFPHPPEFAVPSSSPIGSEPNTPRQGKIMGGPLRMSQLISDSLEHSIPLPPNWHYGEDDDDDEL